MPPPDPSPARRPGDAEGPPAVPGFADRLDEAIRRVRSCLIVGLDPVLGRLPPETASVLPVGPPSSPGFCARAAASLAVFSTGVIDAVCDVAVGVKPNVAFFERFGPAGWDALTQVCRAAKRKGMIVIADAKRGDIGSTAEAYADALLGDMGDGPGPYVDAVTVHPWLGTDSIEPFLRRVRQGGRGIFALVRTSNPSAAELQDLDCGGEPLYLHVARLVERWGRDSVGSSGLSSVGAVVGATRPAVARRLRECLPRTPFLVPGYGAQGGTLEDLRACFLPGGRGAVVNASRSIIFAHENRPVPWQDAVRAAAIAARDEIAAARDETAAARGETDAAPRG